MAKDPYRYFRIEARELIDGLAAGVLALEKSSGGPAATPLLRLTHTLKGAARVVRQAVIADLAHHLEERLAPIRDRAVTPQRSEIDSCLHLVDQMRGALVALGEDAQTVQATAAAPLAQARAVRIDTSDTDLLIEDIAATGRSLGGARQACSALARTGLLARSLADLLDSRRMGPGSDALNHAKRIATELCGDLQRVQDAVWDRLQGAKRELAEIMARAERMRLLPAGSLFASLERVVRDAARELEREVSFETSGGDVGMDATVFDALSESLPHVMRNAVTHGIEASSARRAAGKPPQGRVSLVVSRRGGHIAITCSDDGRGIDLGAITSAAVARGLAAPGQRLDTQSAADLLLRGGISTSQTITELSGRGVGLDVVRSTVESIGGTLTMRSQQGSGTTLEVLVPLSLVSVPALIAEAGGCVAAIPLDAVKQTVRFAGQDMTHAPGGDSYLHDQKVLPAASLAALLGASANSRTQTTGGVVVILDVDGQRAALIVDRLAGTDKVILRSMPVGVEPVPFLAGAGLDDVGVPRLVLDARETISAISGWTSGSQAAGPRPPARILVVDDSLTTRTLEQSILESAGYLVDVATSGEEAMEKAALTSYGLFVVDVEMPGMDGFTFVERTRADAVLGRTPAILVTSRSAPEDRKRGLDAGASAYIVKAEFDQVRLLSLIRDLLD